MHRTLDIAIFLTLVENGLAEPKPAISAGALRFHFQGLGGRRQRDAGWYSKLRLPYIGEVVSPARLCFFLSPHMDRLWSAARPPFDVRPRKLVLVPFSSWRTRWRRPWSRRADGSRTCPSRNGLADPKQQSQQAREIAVSWPRRATSAPLREIVVWWPRRPTRAQECARMRFKG